MVMMMILLHKYHRILRKGLCIISFIARSSALAYSI